MAHWLLIETFGPDSAEPTVIGVGNTPRKMVPLRTFLRGQSSAVIEEAVAWVRRTATPIDVVSKGRRLIAEPLRTFAGNVHGVRAWTGAATEDVPQRPPAGAWQFNLTTDKIAGSDDLLDLYGVPAADRRSERNTAEAFSRLITNADESAALVTIVQAQPGAEHRATWTVRRDDGDLRAAHFSCRAIAETGAHGAAEVMLRGITHDIGPAATTPSAPPAVVLAQQVLAGLAEPGTHRAIVNLTTLRLLRWVTGDDPAPGIAWEHDPGDPISHWIHPEDLPAAQTMAAGLAKGKTSATLRFRTTQRTWRNVPVVAHLAQPSKFIETHWCGTGRAGPAPCGQPCRPGGDGGDIWRSWPSFDAAGAAVAGGCPWDGPVPVDQNRSVCLPRHNAWGACGPADDPGVVLRWSRSPSRAAAGVRPLALGSYDPGVIRSPRGVWPTVCASRVTTRSRRHRGRAHDDRHEHKEEARGDHCGRAVRHRAACWRAEHDRGAGAGRHR